MTRKVCHVKDNLSEVLHVNGLNVVHRRLIAI